MYAVLNMLTMTCLALDFPKTDLGWSKFAQHLYYYLLKGTPLYRHINVLEMTLGEGKKSLLLIEIKGLRGLFMEKESWP